MTQPHRQWERDVSKLAKMMGWTVASFRAVETKKRGWQVPVDDDGKGWPDKIMFKPRLGRIIAAECKTGKATLTDDQWAWLERMHACGVETFIFRPENEYAIAQELRQTTSSIERGVPQAGDGTRGRPPTLPI